ncbi:uncharacterized protein [Haliotis cracherodii]|uniref:uncharacterized protein n=1 Tax=Haliotis cracherodii TaxID=6455 RepID=UPI0039E84F79
MASRRKRNSTCEAAIDVNNQDGRPAVSTRLRSNSSNVRRRYQSINPDSAATEHSHDPSNWYVAELRERIARDIGILHLPNSMSRGQLIQFYSKNVPANILPLPASRTSATSQVRQEFRNIPNSVDIRDVGEPNVIPNEAPRTTPPMTSPSVMAAPTQPDLQSLVATVQALQQSVETITRVLLPHHTQSSPSATDTTTSPSILPQQSTAREEIRINGKFTLSTAIANHAATATQPLDPNTLPRLETASAHLRQQIHEGRDINLALLLIPDDVHCGPRSIQIGDGQLHLKTTNDKRLQKVLNIRDFLKAFERFKKIMLEKFPNRSAELDEYQGIIIGLSNETDDNAFYTYHKMFSAQAAAAIELLNRPVYWGRLDRELYIKIFTSRKANACQWCSELNHTSEFCPLSLNDHLKSSLVPRKPQQIRTNNFDGTDAHGRAIIFHQGQSICNNYNDRGCSHQHCRFMHVCLICKRTHPKFQCRTDKPSKNGKSDK